MPKNEEDHESYSPYFLREDGLPYPGPDLSSAHVPRPLFRCSDRWKESLFNQYDLSPRHLLERENSVMKLSTLFPAANVIHQWNYGHLHLL
ncbi:hypothetical protein AVEN_231168-1 [Araneus ventricosus]|uniref:Uncharacterized protein n=1 Tax=Araneus ventricosus TaxID=182803 RepID=A0A4Y2QHZ2_ARAVE|nr:hypothetical protein AVEN_231168-1 [Araneus ventricosus]